MATAAGTRSPRACSSAVSLAGLHKQCQGGMRQFLQEAEPAPN